MKRLHLDDLPYSLVFERKTDRWWHRLIVQQAGIESTILHSVEGDSWQDWPPSPPLQDLDQHRLADGSTAILGVGKAGKAHWSASFSQQPATSDNHRRWLVEFACLCPADAAAPILGTTYEIANAVRLEMRGNRMEIITSCQKLQIEPLEAQEHSTDMVITGNRLLFSPLPIPYSGRKSVRWGFYIE